MKKPITKENLFKPTNSRSESKAETTNNAARAIIEAEARKRREKSERLRAQRMAASDEKA
jgi:hypothetical protein